MFDIYKVIEKLKTRRVIFVSEVDFQLELAWTIKEEYPNAKIRLEYCPSFDLNMHIDILVIYDNKWIPIELKYKTKGCIKIIDNEVFNLKNQGAKNNSCYLYLKDIERIERIKENEEKFKKGYTIFITNDMIYTIKSKNDKYSYSEFSLEEGIVKSGNMTWKEGTIRGRKFAEDKIYLKGSYKIKWKDYSIIDNSNSGRFKIVINEIN